MYVNGRHWNTHRIVYEYPDSAGLVVVSVWTQTERWIYWSVDWLMQAGVECETCEFLCERERPDGCSHQCQLGVCHQGICPACPQLIRMRCHCALVVRHIECSIWTTVDLNQRNQLQSCGGSCPKHVCILISVHQV